MPLTLSLLRLQTAAEEAKRKLEQTQERLRSAESERDALVQALKEHQDSKDAAQEVCCPH